MKTYDYCVDFAAEAMTDHPGRVLDYGCGAGQIVAALQRRGVDAFGCDVFYGGGDYSEQVPEGMWGTTIRAMEDGRIPYESDSFDLVINNQVMEHVPDLDLALSEIHRVLKPGGKVLSLFPDRGVWREGHCGIPFLHWFPKGSRSRLYYALLLRALGLGHHKNGKGCYRWSRDFCLWLDQWTHYRSYPDLRRAYEKRFVDVTHLEDHRWDRKLGASHYTVRLLPGSLKRLLYRKAAGLVFLCTKPATAEDAVAHRQVYFDQSPQESPISGRVAGSRP